jgi:hypothetical protein
MVSKILSDIRLINSTRFQRVSIIIWNIGHIIVSQQLLVYKLSGLLMMVSDELVEKLQRNQAEHNGR